MILRQKTLFIVEDDDDLRDSTAMLLRRWGYLTHAAACGEDALALLPHIARPDVFLLDQMMPGMSGLDLRARLRKDPALADVPMLVMTASRTALDIPANQLILKPMTFERLLEAIERATRR